MFTTTTPDAQLVSIAKSAVNPPSAVPYPTDVGTAMIGARHDPADDARQRALHPRHDDDGRRAPKIVEPVEQPVDARDADVVHAQRLEPHDHAASRPPPRRPAMSLVPAVTTATGPCCARGDGAELDAAACAPRPRAGSSGIAREQGRGLVRVEARDEHVLPGARQLLGDARRSARPSCPRRRSPPARPGGGRGGDRPSRSRGRGRAAARSASRASSTETLAPWHALEQLADEAGIHGRRRLAPRRRTVEPRGVLPFASVPALVGPIVGFALGVRARLGSAARGATRGRTRAFRARA